MATQGAHSVIEVDLDPLVRKAKGGAVVLEPAIEGNKFDSGVAVRESFDSGHRDVGALGEVDGHQMSIDEQSLGTHPRSIQSAVTFSQICLIAKILLP